MGTRGESVALACVLKATPCLCPGDTLLLLVPGGAGAGPGRTERFALELRDEMICRGQHGNCSKCRQIIREPFSVKQIPGGAGFQRETLGSDRRHTPCCLWGCSWAEHGTNEYIRIGTSRAQAKSGGAERHVH